MVNIMGKNCEIKASEPKTEEAAQYARSSINLPPPHHQQHYHHQQQQQQGWSNHQQMQPQPQRMVFGSGGGAATHPLMQVNQTMPVPPNFNCGAPAGAEANGGEPIYSHSTITRTTAGPTVSADGASHEGASNVYIQNNFYTLPPGAELPPSHAMNVATGPTPEALQAQQTELVQNGGAMSLGQTTVAPVAAPMAGVAPQYTAYAPSALQPSYPGPDVDGTMAGQLQEQQHQQIKAGWHYTNGY